MIFIWEHARKNKGGSDREIRRRIALTSEAVGKDMEVTKYRNTQK